MSFMRETLTLCFMTLYVCEEVMIAAPKQTVVTIPILKMAAIDVITIL